MPDAPGEQKQPGRSAEDIVDGGAGGVFHRALLLYELGSQLEATSAEFECDETEEAIELAMLCGEMATLLRRLSIREDDGLLTYARECPSCSGHGSYANRVVCEDCGGTGIEPPAEKRTEEPT